MDAQSPLRPPRRTAAELDETLTSARPRIRGLLLHQRIPEQDVDDLVQQVLIALVRSWPRVRDPHAWLSGAVRKKCLMYWRSRGRQVYDSVDDQDLEWLAEPQRPDQERDAVRSDLSALVARLPAHYRSVLRLRYALGYAPCEVAEQLGYRASSIGKVTTRGLAALGRELAAEGYGMPDARCAVG